MTFNNVANIVNFLPTPIRNTDVFQTDAIKAA